jgi:hypothetical protein
MLLGEIALFLVAHQQQKIPVAVDSARGLLDAFLGTVMDRLG